MASVGRSREARLETLIQEIHDKLYNNRHVGALVLEDGKLVETGDMLFTSQERAAITALLDAYPKSLHISATDMDMNTFKTHTSRIRRKLGADYEIKNTGLGMYRLAYNGR